MLDTNVDKMPGVGGERRRVSSKQPPKKKQKVTAADMEAKKKAEETENEEYDAGADEGSKEEENNDHPKEGSMMEIDEAGKDEEEDEGLKDNVLGDGGEDNEDDLEEKMPKQRSRAKAKSKTKTKGKAKAKAKGLIRDQSKSKKFNEVWNQLPSELQEHFEELSRAEQTAFIHKGIERNERGRLSLNTGVLFQLKAQREEVQKGKEKMDGYILEDLGLTVLSSHSTNKGPPFSPPSPTQQTLQQF